ncbi:MAG: PPOX class F420-dependent oxidoreductase [Haloarculaceae archaeon]
MASIPSEYQDLFERKTIAHVGTVMPDGAPQVTPVWVDYDADADRLLVNTERDRRKEKNVRNDPRVAVSMTDPEDPYRRLVVRGTVEDITTEGAREHIDELAERYMGVEDYPNPIETERVILSISPEHVTADG